MRDPAEALGSPWYVKNRYPCNWNRIDLQSRDIRLLRILLEQKFLSWEQIRDHFFDGKERYTYIRLWKLRRFDLVRKLGAAFTGYDLYFATSTTQQYFQDQFVGAPAPSLYPP